MNERNNEKNRCAKTGEKLKKTKSQHEAGANNGLTNEKQPQQVERVKYQKALQRTN